MDIEQYYHYYIAGVYGLMLIIRLIYGWQVNRQGGKPVSRREPGWSPILMGILMFLSNGIVLVDILWSSAIKATSIEDMSKPARPRTGHAIYRRRG